MIWPTRLAVARRSVGGGGSGDCSLSQETNEERREASHDFNGGGAWHSGILRRLYMYGRNVEPQYVPRMGFDGPGVSTSEAEKLDCSDA
jgi:hypothetical protein